MSRIVETYPCYFSSKPLYILCFDIDKTICTHSITYIEQKNRQWLVGQWIIKYKQQ